MRRFIVLTISLGLLVGSLILLAVAVQTRDYSQRGYENPTRTQDLPFRLPILGVNADLRQYNDEQLQYNIEQMKQANINWVRQFVYWDEVEPQKGQYNWALYDPIISSFADEHSIQLILVVMNTPQWATANPNIALATTPPNDPSTFASFTSVLAQRYGHIVDYYQIWDEPNLYEAWGNTNPKPTEYLALLQTGYTTIHQADSQATVIMGALAPTTEVRGRNISDWIYLQDLYTLGLAQSSDGIAGKAYGFDFSPLDRDVLANKLNFSRVVGLREVMLKNNDAKTHLWLSEGGWNSLPQDWQGDNSVWGNVSSQIQQQHTQEAIQRIEQEWTWAGGFTLSYWQPNLSPTNARWGFSFLNQDNAPTPLLQSLLTRTSNKLPRNGVYPAQNIFATYSGVWTFSDLGADIGWLETSDSRLKFNFWGSDIALLLRKGDYVAFLYPQVDSLPANATQKDSSGNAYVFLQSASLKPELELISISENLSLGEHQLEVVADRGWDQWALAGFAVSDGDLSEPYNNQVSVAFIASFLTLLAFLTTFFSFPNYHQITQYFVIGTRLSDTLLIILGGFTSFILMLSMLWTFGDSTPQILRKETSQLGIAVIVTAGLVALEIPFLGVIFSCLVLFVLIFNRIQIGLMLILFWSPFFLFPVEIFQFAFPIAELVLWITVGAWCLQKINTLGKWLQIRVSQFPASISLNLHMLDYGVIGIIVLATLSLAWTQRQFTAITELRTLIIEPSLFYLLLRHSVQDTKSWLRLVDVLIFAGFTICIIGIVAYLRGDAIITAEDGARRLASVYGSPNNVGLFLGRCLPFVWSFMFIPLDYRRRIIASIIACTMLITVALTQSTGAILFGIPAGFITVVLLVYRRKALLPLLICLPIAIILIALLTQFSARFAKLLNLSDGTNFIRLRVWESALAIIRENPLTGLGLDQFLYVFRSEYIKPDAIQDMNLSHPHNFLLDYWIRLGIGGVVLFVSVQIIFWRTTFRILRLPLLSFARAILIGVMGSMMATLAHGLIDNSVFVLDLAIIFAFSLALIANFAQSPPIDEHHKE